MSINRSIEEQLLNPQPGSAAGRTKDLLVLPELEALREVLQKSED